MDESETNGYEQFQEELKKIRSDYNRAKRLLQNIEEYGERFEKIRTLLDDENDGLDANLEWAKGKSAEMTDLKESADQYLTEIKDRLEKVKGQINSMQTAYEEFSEVKGRIDGKSGEIQTLLTTAQSLKTDIDQTKTEAQQTLQNIKNLFTDIQGKIDEMRTAHQEFLVIKDKIEDEDSGLEAIFTEVEALQKKAKALHTEIQGYRDDSLASLKNIQKTESDSQKLKDKIVEHLDFSNEKKSEIQAVTDLIIDTGFANAFQSRAKKLFWSYIVWGIVLILSIVALIVLLGILFYRDFNDVPEINIILYRLTLTSPLLFLIAFAMKQFSNERDLNERYEFKATTATVIRNHVNFLIETFGSPDAVQELIQEIFSAIYREPYAPIGTKKEKDASLKIDTKDLLAITKEAKAGLSAEGILEKILEVLLKGKK